MSWIPVEERLPERGYWLVSFSTGLVISGYHTERGYWYVDEDCEDMLMGVIAWQPLPEPYKKPRRFVVEVGPSWQFYVVDITLPISSGDRVKAKYIPTREAADKIADIYEEAYRGE